MSLEFEKTKEHLFLIAFLLIGNYLFAQVAPEKYWIQFTDKNNSPFSISNPSAYLSQRAIDRRANQNIQITEQDLPVNPSYVLGVEQSAAVNVLISSRWLNGIVIQTTDTNGLDAIMNLPFVDSAGSRSVQKSFFGETSSKMKLQGTKVPAEKKSPNNDRSIDYGYSENQNKMIHVDYLHNLGFTGSGMVIAILDAGFYGSDTTTVLTSLFADNRVLGTWDFVLNQPIDYTQYSNHGAFVLNCMAANEPGFYVGSAPDASYWLLRTEDAPTENIIEEYNWVAGAEFADSAGADVFNTSLGYTTFDDSNYNHTYADLDGNTAIITIGADIAASKGILVINSAGNSGAGDWYYIGAPADGDSVLAIGAVNPSRGVTGFSSRGPSYDGRVKPNVMAQGGAVPMPIGIDTIFNINGTSFSGPILAGAAACLWQSQLGYNNMDIYHAIEESSDRFTNPNDDYGFGIPNMGLAHYFVTGIEDLNTYAFSSQVYPNPTEGIVYITGINQSSAEYARVELYDLSGSLKKRMVPTWSGNDYIVDISEQTPGVYFLKVITDVGNQTLRVVKF
ncbi:MAG: S8 family serine peptidase [Salibacteraceae bacterium]